MSLATGFLRLAGLLPDAALAALTRALFSGSWRRFLHATAHPAEVQTARLLALVERARDTDFGRAHGFDQVRSLADYQRQVPIRGFEDYEPFLARMVAGEKKVLLPDEPFFYGRSSGTTGTPKHIPITPTYVAEYRLPRRVWARQVLQAFPGLIRGKLLSVHSPKIEGHTEGGVPYGSVTVGLTQRPGAVEKLASGSPLDAVPRSVFLIDDFELKYYVTLRLALQERITLATAINPSTLVLLAKKLDQHAEALARDLVQGSLHDLERLPEPIRGEVRRQLRKDRRAAERLLASKAKHGRVVATEVWPELLGLLCWKGGSAPFYLAQLERWFPGRPIMDYGFLATEGGFSIPLGTEGSHGVVAVLGHVLEFVPEGQPEATPVLADRLEVGGRYRVVITAANGLWRYDINDIVECAGYFQKTAEIRFLHKGGNMLSITGEKVGESHVVEAMARLHPALHGFSVVVELGDPPRYRVAVEPHGALDSAGASALAQAFDRALAEVNLEYAAKRSSGRLGPPEVLVLPPGAYERERARRVAAGAPDAHVKPPHLSRDPELLRRLESLP